VLPFSKVPYLLPPPPYHVLYFTTSGALCGSAERATRASPPLWAIA
jgi:hypothetical protein